MIFLRIRLENKNDHFWKIFQAAGGNYFQRRKIFLLQSFFLIVFSIGLKIVIFYSLEYYRYADFLNFKQNRLYLGLYLYEGVTLFAANLICGAVLWKKL